AGARGPPANVAPEIPGADHRQAASSTLEIPGGFLRVCVLAWRRRHPGLSRTTSPQDPLGARRAHALDRTAAQVLGQQCAPAGVEARLRAAGVEDLDARRWRLRGVQDA